MSWDRILVTVLGAIAMAGATAFFFGRNLRGSP
jgi:hypothetical protein